MILFVPSYYDSKRNICTTLLKFYQDSPPYKETRRHISISYQKTSEIRSMVIKDLRTNRTEEEKNEVIVLIDAIRLKNF